MPNSVSKNIRLWKSCVVELKDGDVITVGKATIVFSEENAGACSGCGVSLRPGAKFCAKCGQKAA